MLFFAAVAFYVSLLLVLFIPGLRKGFQSVYSLPVPSTRRTIECIDTFRGFAILWVVVGHATGWLGPYFKALEKPFGWLTQGDKGVPVFVVLSGFLVYRALRKAATFEDLRKYFVRRFFRIYPLYAFSLIVIFLFGYRVISEASFQKVLAEFLMFPVITGSDFSNPPAWSLYVEEFFYLSLPIWVAITRKIQLKAAIIGFLAFAAIGSGFSRELLLFRYFFIGIALCEIIDLPRVQNMRSKTAWSLLVLGLFFFFIDTRSIYLGVEKIFYEFFETSFPALSQYFSPHYGPYTVLTGLSFALVFLGVLHLPKVNRVVSWYPFRFVGIISYSIFLFHGMVLLAHSGAFFNGNGGITGQLLFTHEAGWITFGFIYIPALLFFSAATFALVEKPFMNLRVRMEGLPRLNH